MATRLYFSSTQVPTLSPAFSAEWEHQSQAIRRSMTPIKGNSPVASLTTTVDAADHLVNQDNLFVQLQSEPLHAQSIAAQQVKLQCRVAEANAGNNLFMTWKLYLIDSEGAVVSGGEMLAIRRDALEVGTALANRGDSANIAAVTASAGDRIVLELGLGGLPVATTGVQDHDGIISAGESGNDAPENDTDTTLVAPWLEFANDLTFRLTTDQQNAILKQIMVRVADNLDGDDEAFYVLLRACIAQVRLGGADNIEGGKFWAQALYERVTGQSATAADLHMLRNHLAIGADPTAGGVL